jgi:4,5-DOPA dioxygenase extradiol
MEKGEEGTHLTGIYMIFKCTYLLDIITFQRASLSSLFLFPLPSFLPFSSLLPHKSLDMSCTPVQSLPTIFINHGGGPLPLLGAQPSIASSIRNARPSQTPKAVLIVSAHYEASPISILSNEKHPMLFDYYGFPPQAYEYSYPARGDDVLASRIQNLFADSGIESNIESKRGLDHGMFIPLMLMYPSADIPVVGLSLHPSLDVATHIKIGKALRSLRDDVLILGSGYGFHNMRYLLGPTKASINYSQEFDAWLQSVLVGKITESSLEKLVHWEQDAPHARECHPREEHLIPLFVVAAAAGEEAVGEVMDIAEGKMSGEHTVSNFRFQ